MLPVTDPRAGPRHQGDLSTRADAGGAGTAGVSGHVDPTSSQASPLRPPRPRRGRRAAVRQRGERDRARRRGRAHRPPQLETQLREVVAQREEQLSIHLDDVTFLDSNRPRRAGRGLEGQTAQGGRFVLVCTQPRLLRLLEVTVSTGCCSPTGRFRRVAPRAENSTGRLARLGFEEPERARGCSPPWAPWPTPSSRCWDAARTPDLALSAPLARPRRGRPRPRRAARRGGRRRGHLDAAARGPRCQPGPGRAPAAPPRALARAVRPDPGVHPAPRPGRCGRRCCGRSGRTPTSRSPWPASSTPRRRTPCGWSTAACCCAWPRATWPTTSASTTLLPSWPTWPPARSRRRWRSPGQGGGGRRDLPAGGGRDGQVRGATSSTTSATWTSSSWPSRSRGSRTSLRCAPRPSWPRR